MKVDQKTINLLALIAYKHAEISIGRACEITGWPADKVKNETEMRIGTIPVYATVLENLWNVLDMLKDGGPEEETPYEDWARDMTKIALYEASKMWGSELMGEGETSLEHRGD